MDLSALTLLQRNSKKSYNDQKALIKKVLAGKNVLCVHCKQAINFQPADDVSQGVVSCKNGCTNIRLDMG